MVPQSIDEYIDEDDPVRLIEAYVEGLDLESFRFKGTNPLAVAHHNKAS